MVAFALVLFVLGVFGLLRVKLLKPLILQRESLCLPFFVFPLPFLKVILLETQLLLSSFVVLKLQHVLGIGLSFVGLILLSEHRLLFHDAFGSWRLLLFIRLIKGFETLIDIFQLGIDQ